MATLEKRIYDADRAREVLENEAFVQAFADIQQEITDQWKNSPVRDEEGRRELYQLLRMSDKLKITLEGMLTDGKMAKSEREYQERLLAQQRAEGVSIG